MNALLIIIVWGVGTTATPMPDIATCDKMKVQLEKSLTWRSGGTQRVFATCLEN